MRAWKLAELAGEMGGRLDGAADLGIRGVAGIREAEEGDLTFLADKRYLPYLETTRASAIICRDDLETSLPAIRVADPHLAFLRAIEIFSQPPQLFFPEGISEAAHVDPTARLGKDVRVGPGSVIGPDCVVGDASVIAAGVVLMPRVKVGRDCILYPNVVVREECEIGDRVILHAGAVIGSDGFGFAKKEGHYHKIPQIGRVVIGSDVEIGANTCIDRATTGLTLIAHGTKLDNLVQIAHNVRIGEHTVISAQTGISGSTEVGDDVMMAGQVGVVGHIRIGDGAQIGAQSGISKNVPAGEAWFGYPARNSLEAKRLIVHYGRLERYAAEIAELKSRLEALERTYGATPTENP